MRALAYRISRLRLVSCPGAIATVVDQASRLSGPHLPTLITWALAFANSNSGNEIVRPETLGPARRELSPKRAKPTAETVFRAQATEISRYFLTLENHVGLRGLPGGIRTCD